MSDFTNGRGTVRVSDALQNGEPAQAQRCPLLSEIARELGLSLEGPVALTLDPQIFGVVDRVEDVQSGDLLICRDSYSDQDLERAKERGAVGLVAAQDLVLAGDLPILRSKLSTRSLARLDRLIHGDPSRQLTTIVVAGENRSDIAYWLTEMLNRTHGPTRHFDITGEGQRYNQARLLPALALHARAGGVAAIIEVDSVATSELLLCALDIDVLVHGGVGSERKDRADWRKLEGELDLIRRLERNAALVIDATDPTFEDCRREALSRIVSFGLLASADVSATFRRLEAQRSILNLKTPLGTTRVRLSAGHDGLLRSALAALTGALALGIDLDDAAAALESTPQRSGRHERLMVPLPYEVWIGQGSSADSIAQNLAAVDCAEGGRKWVVFGCGAEFSSVDPRGLGLVLAREADVLILTGPIPGVAPSIAAVQSLTACIPSVGHIVIERDREIAIRRGLEGISRGDVLYVIGDGEPEVDRSAVTRWFLDGLIAS